MNIETTIKMLDEHKQGVFFEEPSCEAYGLRLGEPIARTVWLVPLSVGEWDPPLAEVTKTDHHEMTVLMPSGARYVYPIREGEEFSAPVAKDAVVCALREIAEGAVTDASRTSE